MRQLTNPFSKRLTTRETQIVKMMINGSTTREISKDLHISMDTVKTHRKNIHRKLDTHSVVQLMLKMQGVELV